jgi:hypothetical protein
MLATLAQVRALLDLPTPPDLAAARAVDAALLAAIDAASAALEQATGRRFSPTYSTRPHALPRDRITLVLGDDLLTLEALEDAAGPIAPEAVTLWPPTPPHSLIVLGGGRCFVGDGRPAPVRVRGQWGWHSRWPSAFRFTHDAVLNTPSLAFDAATVRVHDADGHDGQPPNLGAEPRFPVGALLSFGLPLTTPTEYVRVLALDAAADTVQVARGQAGTQPTEHAALTDLFRFVPDRAVSAVVCAWAAALYLGEGPGSAPGQPPPALHDAVLNLRRV